MLPRKYCCISQLALKRPKAGIQVRELEMVEFQARQEMGMVVRQEVEVPLQAAEDVLLDIERKGIVE